jgi:hypothetical protein
VKRATFLRSDGHTESETILVFVAGREYGVGVRERRRSACAAGWRQPLQFILIVVTVAAAMLFNVRPSQAYQAPWCAGTNRGGGTFVYNCSMRTLEQCVSEAIAANRILHSEPIFTAGLKWGRPG